MTREQYYEQMLEITDVLRIIDELRNSLVDKKTAAFFILSIGLNSNGLTAIGGYHEFQGRLCNEIQNVLDQFKKADTGKLN